MAEKGGHWVKSAGGGMSFKAAGGGSAASASAGPREVSAKAVGLKLTLGKQKTIMGNRWQRVVATTKNGSREYDILLRAEGEYLYRGGTAYAKAEATKKLEKDFGVRIIA